MFGPDPDLAFGIPCCLFWHSLFFCVVAEELQEIRIGRAMLLL
jgi:hypothetical protein